MSQMERLFMLLSEIHYELQFLHECSFNTYRFPFNCCFAVHNLCTASTVGITFVVYTRHIYRNILKDAVQLEDVLQGSLAAVGSDMQQATE